MQNSQSLGQPALYYQGRYYPLNRPQMIIGSDPSCDVRIENNSRVLPNHAQIISQNGQVFLMYMERGAGIWVNGAPASQQQLQDQDEIALGNGETRLKLLLNWKANGTGAQNNGAAEGTLILGNGSSSAALLRESYASGLAPQQVPPTVAASPFKALGQQPPATPPLGAAPRGAQAPAQQMAFAAPQPQPAQQVAFAPQPIPQTPASASNTATNTTRYLCAAGHLDEIFQDYVLRHVIHEERRALGESYGVDMLAVVSWCKAGIARINVRDFILTAFLVLDFLAYVYILFSIGHALITASQAASALNNPYGNNPYGNPYASNPYTTTSASLISPLIIILTLGTIVFFQFFWAAIWLFLANLAEKWIKSRWPKARTGILTHLVATVQIFPFGLLLMILSWFVIFIELILRFYGKTINQLRKHNFNQQARPVQLDFALETKLRESFSTNQRNLVVYSGYRPFAGAGDYLTGWSFVIDTSKGAPLPLDPHTRLTPQKFTTSSLYEAIEKDARTLGFNELEIEGKLYVRGQYLPEHSYFFNSNTMRPLTSVDPKLVDYYKENSTEDIRYYQCLRFNSWRGEIIFTAFLRFVQRDKSLFVEFDYLLLPPLVRDYYWADERELTPTFGKIWELYLRSFDHPLKTVFFAPYRLFRGPIYTARQNRLARLARNNPAFDYGADSSARYTASDDEYHLFFQQLDKEMYLKTIRKQTLETIHAFLQAHQIDTSEFDGHQQTILNAGTIVSGGNIHIGAMSTGDNGVANNTAAPAASGQP